MGMIINALRLWIKIMMNVYNVELANVDLNKITVFEILASPENRASGSEPSRRVIASKTIWRSFLEACRKADEDDCAKSHGDRLPRSLA